MATDNIVEVAVQSFVWRVEALLLSTESGLTLESPLGVSENLAAECKDLARLATDVRAADLISLLGDSWLKPISAVLQRTAVEAALDGGDLTRLGATLCEACAEFIAAAPSGGESVRSLGVLLLAAGALQLYVQVNWTGPPLADEQQNNPCLPFHPSTPAELQTYGRLFLQALEVDGEPVYELVCGIGYLWLATTLLGILPQQVSISSALASCHTRGIWSGRCGFIWQLSLAEASERGMGQSPWLFKVATHDLVGDPEEWGPLASNGVLTGKALSSVRAVTFPVVQAWKNASSQAGVPISTPAALVTEGDTANIKKLHDESPLNSCGPLKQASSSIKASLLIELALRMCWYGRFKAFDSVLQAACDALNFSFEVTGVLGIKRKYQTDEFAQLMVKTSSAEAEGGAMAALAEMLGEGFGDDTKTPENLQLTHLDDLNDVLEAPKLSSTLTDNDREKLEMPLGAIEQTILLGRCHYLWASSNPNDEMVLLEVNALAQRVLVVDEDKPIEANADDGKLFTANWLCFSCGLWYRCRAEHHRNKTRERAAFQLQALVDQFRDEKPSANHRLLHVHTSGYPARFHLQHEMGMRMMKMGMVSTAHEQFKKLKMWPEAVDCLMIAGRNVEATDMVKELLANEPNPRLWCCLGDLEKNPQHYETAWAASGNKFARAQRSLGQHHFRKGEIAKAIESFRQALAINPLHSSIWFTMGCGEMKLERWDDALMTFARCLGIEDDHPEAWANLAAVHSARGSLREARTCMLEATKRARQNSRMWESYLGVCMQLRDLSGCINALRRFVELEQIGKIKERVLGMITMAVVSDAQGLCDGRSGKSFAGQLREFFRFLTSNCATVPFHWQFYAELQDAGGAHAAALESRLRQCRAIQATMWDVIDPQAFTTELQGLVECFEAIEEALQEPSLREEAGEHLQPFAYLVRNAVNRLQAKIDAAVQESEWTKTCQVMRALANRAEERAGTTLASGMATQGTTNSEA